MQQFPELLDDDPTLDFADLDAIIAETEERKRTKSSIKGKLTKLAHGGLTPDERARLQAEVREYEDHHVWRTVAAVALFKTQTCACCGSHHRFFEGWMTAQDHRSDPNARRLVRGKPVEIDLPQRIQEHTHGACEMCSNCAEAQLIIDRCCNASTT